MKPIFLALILVSFLGAIEGIDWNEMLAERQLMYSYAAYCNEREILSWGCDWCRKTPRLQSIEYLYDFLTQTNGFIGVYENTIAVNFRGSSSIVNWIQNLKFFKDPYKNVQGAEVHKGFLESYNAIKPSMFDAIKRLRSKHPEVSKISFTGHSLGAALATLASLDVIESNLFAPDEVLVIHFGGPRVGNAAFSNYYNRIVKHSIRTTHGADTVVHLPPRLFGYEHNLREVWESKTRQYKVCSESNGEDPSCANSQLPLGVGDHLVYMGHRKADGRC